MSDVPYNWHRIVSNRFKKLSTESLRVIRADALEASNGAYYGGNEFWLDEHNYACIELQIRKDADESN